MELKLGKNKTIEISAWKTKTKKDFLNIIREKEKNLSEDDVLDVLIKPYIKPNDIYFSEAELQWILINLRNISIESNMKFLIDCSNCKEEITIECKLMDLCDYKLNSFPIIKGERAWKDISNLNELKEYVKKYKDEFPKNIEMLLHLDGVGKNKFNSFNEKIEYFDNLDLQEGNTLLSEFDEINSNIKLSYKIKCPHCDNIDTYIFEEIPDFFEPLLPKEL
jgi:hypothetical protein